ncbi:hypothetical protein N9077_01395, partial [bacterium]|nr:hypothetical protein [bacterium]
MIAIVRKVRKWNRFLTLTKPGKPKGHRATHDKRDQNQAPRNSSRKAPDHRDDHLSDQKHHHRPEPVIHP